MSPVDNLISSFLLVYPGEMSGLILGRIIGGHFTFQILLAEFDNKKWGEMLTVYNNFCLFGEGEVVPHADILCLVVQLCVPR